MECNTLPSLRPTQPTIRYFATKNNNSAVILWDAGGTFLHRPPAASPQSLVLSITLEKLFDIRFLAFIANLAPFATWTRRRRARAVG
jgi:hypothetical protein